MRLDRNKFHKINQGKKVHLALIALINALKGDITAKGKKSKCGTQNCSTMATASEHKKNTYLSEYMQKMQPKRQK